MLTDTALRNLKPKSKIYKASDRDGMYVTVSTTSTVTFRYDYLQDKFADHRPTELPVLAVWIRNSGLAGN